MIDKIKTLVRDVPPALGMQILFTHALLLLGSFWGGVSYPIVQLLFAAEILLITIGSTVFYSERHAAKHATDVLKMAALLLFVLMFLFVTYGIVAKEAGQTGMPLELTIRALRNIDIGDLGWALAYVLARIAFSGFQAWRSRDPRRAWARQNYPYGASTLIAMLFMVFATFFVGVPIQMLTARIHWHVDVDALLAGIMICLRCFTALVAATVSDKQMDAIAHSPYVE